LQPNNEAWKYMMQRSENIYSKYNTLIPLSKLVESLFSNAGLTEALRRNSTMYQWTMFKKLLILKANNNVTSVVNSYNITV